MKIQEIISEIQTSKETIVIAIDGRCAAGKTTLADQLADALDAQVFRMDDYFLRPEQRTSERYREVGGNVDRERFYEEIGSKLHTNKDIVYTPFDCKTMAMKESILVKQRRITIIEGSYSCHPDLISLYDKTFFLDIPKELQKERLKKRNPHNYADFIEKWIPYEEKYFDIFDIRHACDVVLHAEEILSE